MRTTSSTRTVKIGSTLPAPAETVWRAVTTPTAFVHVARGMVRFPAAERVDRPWREGDEIVGLTLLFGVLPFSWHRLRVEAVCTDARELQTDEGGGLVRSWRHLIRVTPIGPERCRYEDLLEIDAGRLTSLVVAYARIFYWYRQRRWRALARMLAMYDEAAGVVPRRSEGVSD